MANVRPSSELPFSFRDRATAAVIAFTSALNDPLLFSDSYWVVDANAALFDKGNWQVAAWVRNLADARYVTQGLNQLVFGNGFRVYGAPRTFGLTLTKEFN